MTIILLIISAIFRALDQMLRFYGNSLQWDADRVGWVETVIESWLPDFTWSWSIFGKFDAEHTYMGLKLITFGLAFYPWYLFGIQPFEYGWMNYPDWWYWLPLYILGYYQVFNLFFHVIFCRVKYMSFPFVVHFKLFAGKK